jgi:hypothetical protein
LPAFVVLSVFQSGGGSHCLSILSYSTQRLFGPFLKNWVTRGTKLSRC